MTIQLTWEENEFIRRMGEGAEQERVGFELLLKHRSNFHEFFGALDAKGFFAEAKNSGPVPAEEPGHVRIPYWPALDYLEACARRAGELGDQALASKVLGVVRAVSRARGADGKAVDNFHTWRKFAEILALLPTDCLVSSDMDLVAIWLSSRFDSGLVVQALDVTLLPKLLASPAAEDALMACAVLGHCTKIEWVKDDVRGGHTKAITAADDYWLRDLISHHATALGEKAGECSVRVMIDRVREVFGAKSGSRRSWLSRPAVDEHEQNHDWEGADNRVVEGLRDMMLAWFDAKPSLARVVIEDALSDDSEMVRRVAIYVLNQKWPGLRQVLPRLDAARMFHPGHLHELYELLSAHFNGMQLAERNWVVDGIRALPLPSEGEDRERRRRLAQLGWLEAIVGKGDAEVDRWHAELASDPELGVSDHPSFHSYVETRWGPGPTPYRPQELVDFAMAGLLVATLNEFVETGGWRSATTSALVDSLEEAVAADPMSFLGALPVVPSAKRPYQYGIISGFKKAWELRQGMAERARWEEIWPALMSLMEALVFSADLWSEQVEDPKVPMPYSIWIPPLIADVLASGTRSDDRAYPEHLLQRARAVLEHLLGNVRPAAAAGSDPMNQAINAPRGRVLEALFSHALRACRLEDKAQGGHAASWDSLRGLFSAELDRCTNGNFEFSTLAGSNIAQLHYLGGGWLRESVGRIFPREYEANFVCAIAGLAYASLPRPVYEVLAESDVLQRAFASPLKGGQTKEQLVDRVILAYLWGDEELDSPRIAPLFEAGDPRLLEFAASFLWGARDEELSRAQIDRVLEFWRKALKWANERPEPAKGLLSRLSLLSTYIREMNPAVLQLLLAVAPFAHVGHHGSQFLEQLVRLADSASREIAQVLKAFVAASQPSYDYKDHLKTALRKLAAGGCELEALELAESLRTLDGMRDLYAELSGRG